MDIWIAVCLETYPYRDIARKLKVQAELVLVGYLGDKLFASVTLDSDELSLYQQVYNRLTLDNHSSFLKSIKFPFESSKATDASW